MESDFPNAFAYVRTRWKLIKGYSISTLSLYLHINSFLPSLSIVLFKWSRFNIESIQHTYIFFGGNEISFSAISYCAHTAHKSNGITSEKSENLCSTQNAERIEQ